MNIATVSSAPPVGIPQVDETAPNLISPDSVLAYCTSRLTALDDIIKTRFAEQQQNNRRLQDAGRALSVLSRFSGMVAGAAGEFRQFHVANARDLAGVWNTSSDASVRRVIEEKYETITGKPLPIVNGVASPPASDDDILDTKKIKQIKPEEWPAHLTALKTFQDDISKTNELSMIQLQSVVSQRQLAIQLTTQLMASIAESSKTIAQNIPVRRR